MRKATPRWAHFIKDVQVAHVKLTYYTYKLSLFNVDDGCPLLENVCPPAQSSWPQNWEINDRSHRTRQITLHTIFHSLPSPRPSYCSRHYRKCGISWWEAGFGGEKHMLTHGLGPRIGLELIPDPRPSIFTRNSQGGIWDFIRFGYANWEPSQKEDEDGNRLQSRQASSADGQRAPTGQSAQLDADSELRRSSGCHQRGQRAPGQQRHACGYGGAQRVCHKSQVQAGSPLFCLCPVITKKKEGGYWNKSVPGTYPWKVARTAHGWPEGGCGSRRLRKLLLVKPPQGGQTGTHLLQIYCALFLGVFSHLEP